MIASGSINRVGAISAFHLAKRVFLAGLAARVPPQIFPGENKKSGKTLGFPPPLLWSGGDTQCLVPEALANPTSLCTKSRRSSVKSVFKSIFRVYTHSGGIRSLALA